MVINDADVMSMDGLTHFCANCAKGRNAIFEVRQCMRELLNVRFSVVTPGASASYYRAIPVFLIRMYVIGDQEFNGEKHLIRRPRGRIRGTHAHTISRFKSQSP